MTEIKSITIPHNFRNRFLKNSGSSTVTNNENNSTSGGGQQFIPRNLWGQYFDDTQDINGDLTSSGTIAGQQGNFSGAIYGMQGSFGAQGIQTTGKVTGQQGKFGAGGMETTGAIKASGNITSSAAIQAYGNIVSSNGGMQAKSHIVSNEGDVRGVQMISDTFRTINFVPANGWIGQGFGVQTDSNNISSLQTDNLTVLGTMLVHTLNIREVSYIGGSYLLTPAASTVQAVQNIYVQKSPQGESSYPAFESNKWTTDPDEARDLTEIVGYRLLWKADDGSTYTMNYWYRGDIAYCHTFNITEPGSYTDFQNQNYKRTVVNVGTVTIDDVDYHFVDVANTTTVNIYDKNNNRMTPYHPVSGYMTGNTNGVMASSTTPKGEDKVVCLGNDFDLTRQGAIQINAGGDINAEGEASIGIYDGIYDFRSLNNYEIHYFSQTAVRMNANYMTWTAGPQGAQSQADFMMGQQGIALSVQDINTGLQTAGINLSTGKITSQADKFEWLDSNNNQILGMQSGYAQFNGTVKAQNFYHTIALTAGQQGVNDSVCNTFVVEENSNASRWIGFATDTTVNNKTFYEGKYYRVEDIDQTTWNDLEGEYFDNWDWCTGYADDISIVNHSGTGYHPAPIIIIPRAQDMPGKAITIRNVYNLTAKDATIYQVDYYYVNFDGTYATPPFYNGASIGSDQSGTFIEKGTSGNYLNLPYGKTFLLSSFGDGWVKIAEW